MYKWNRLIKMGRNVMYRRDIKKLKSPGSGLFSHAVASAVSSVLKRFTTVFGMGTGGSVSLVPPRDLNSISLFPLYQDQLKYHVK